VLVVCAGFYAYHNSLHGAFVFDDEVAILTNPSIRQFWPLWSVLSAPAGTVVSRRPIVNVSFAINYALGGLNVWGYHVVNAGIHILAALALYGIVRRTLRRPGLRERYGEGTAWLALAVALVWVVHPLQTESVNYTTQRTELLMGLFFLLTLYCVIRGAESSSRATAWYVVAVLSSYSRAIRIKSDSPEMYSNLGNALVRQGRLKEAGVYYAKALQIVPSAAIHHN